MRKIYASPSRYVQGEGELSNLGDYVKGFGKKALIVALKDDLDRVRENLDEALQKHPFELFDGGFNGQCTRKEYERLHSVSVERECHVIIGLGGGKALDAAKAASHFARKPVIIAPTIASTDAPCSSLAAMYKDNGEFERYLYCGKNPELVLVDTGIIARAPTRFLVAGMGDALSTYFEARACQKSLADNLSGGKTPNAALAIAKLCYETLLEDSAKAIEASEANTVTPALENIIEANILLSGIGFESCGLAAAHAVHNGLTVLEETHKYVHGEKVAFGTIVQLVLENAPREELDQVIDYCKSVNLPASLSDLGIGEISDERLMEAAIAACAEGGPIGNMPFPVTPQQLFTAIRSADKIANAK